MLFAIDAELALVVLAIVPILAVLGALLQRRAREPLRGAREATTQQIAVLEETVIGIRTVRTFAQEERHRRRFDELNGRQRALAGQGQRTIVTFQAAALGAGMLLIAVVVAVAGAQSADGAVPVGTVVSFMAYLRLAFAPLPDLATAAGQGTQARTSLEHIFGLLAEPVATDERPGALELGRLAGDLRFEGVDFAYRDGNPVLHDSTSRSRRARPWRWWARPAGGRRPWSGSPCASTTPRPDGCRSTATTCATSARSRCASRSATCPRSRFCSPAPCATTSPSPSPRRPTTRSAPRRPRSPGSACSSACRMAWTRVWARAARRCRRARTS